LRELEDGPLRVTGLADSVNVTQPTASRHVQYLERRGLIERSPDKADGRGTIVELTDRGREVNEIIARLRETEMQRVLADWTDFDVALLALLIDRLEGDLKRQSSWHR
jgi:DNA-binding MarR family transcriptional regulator